MAVSSRHDKELVIRKQPRRRCGSSKRSWGHGNAYSRAVSIFVGLLERFAARPRGLTDFWVLVLDMAVQVAFMLDLLSTIENDNYVTVPSATTY